MSSLNLKNNIEVDEITLNSFLNKPPGTVCSSCHAILIPDRADCLECGTTAYPLEKPEDDYFIQFCYSLKNSNYSKLLDYQKRKGLYIVPIEPPQFIIDFFNKDLELTLVKLYHQLNPMNKKLSIYNVNQAPTIGIKQPESFTEIESPYWNEFRTQLVEPVNRHISQSMKRLNTIIDEVELIKEHVFTFSDIAHLHGAQVQTDIINSLNDPDLAARLESYLQHDHIQLMSRINEHPLEKLIYIENFAYSPHLRLLARRILSLQYHLYSNQIENCLKDLHLTLDKDELVVTFEPLYQQDRAYFLEWICQLISWRGYRKFYNKEPFKKPWLPYLRLRNILNACPNPSDNMKKWQNLMNLPTTQNSFSEFENDPDYRMSILLKNKLFSDPWMVDQIKNGEYFSNLSWIINSNPKLASIPVLRFYKDEYLKREMVEILDQTKRLVSVLNIPIEISEEMKTSLYDFLSSELTPVKIRLKDMAQRDRAFLELTFDLNLFFQTTTKILELISQQKNNPASYTNDDKFSFSLFWKKDLIHFEANVINQLFTDSKSVYLLGLIFKDYYKRVESLPKCQIDDGVNFEIFSKLIELDSTDEIKCFFNFITDESQKSKSLIWIQELLTDTRFFTLLTAQDSKKIELIVKQLLTWKQLFVGTTLFHDQWMSIKQNILLLKENGKISSPHPLDEGVRLSFGDKPISAPSASSAGSQIHPETKKLTDAATKANLELERELADKKRALINASTVEALNLLNQKRREEILKLGQDFQETIKQLVSSGKIDQLDKAKDDLEKGITEVNAKYDDLVIKAKSSLTS